MKQLLKIKTLVELLSFIKEVFPKSEITFSFDNVKLEKWQYCEISEIWSKKRERYDRIHQIDFIKELNADYHAYTYLQIEFAENQEDEEYLLSTKYDKKNLTIKNFIKMLNDELSKRILDSI